MLPKQVQDKAGQQGLGGSHYFLHEYAVDQLADAPVPPLERQQVAFRRLARWRIHANSVRRHAAHKREHVGNRPVA